MADPAGTKTVEEAKKRQKDPTPPRNVKVRDVITQKARKSGIVPADSKSYPFEVSSDPTIPTTQWNRLFRIKTISKRKSAKKHGNDSRPSHHRKISINYHEPIQVYFKVRKPKIL